MQDQRTGMGQRTRKENNNYKKSKKCLCLWITGGDNDMTEK